MKKADDKNLISPSRDDLLERVNNKYKLSVLVAKRAKQLYENDDPLIDEYYISKVSMAINEIDQGKVKIIPGEGRPEEKR